MVKRYEKQSSHVFKETEAQVIIECDQCVQAFDIASNMVLQLEAEEPDSDGEPVESNEGRYYRYANSDLSENSDPGFWYEVHGEQQERGAESVERSTPEDGPEEKNHKRMKNGRA